MSHDDEKPVIEVGEEAWEEDPPPSAAPKDPPRSPNEEAAQEEPPPSAAEEGAQEEPPPSAAEEGAGEAPREEPEEALLGDTERPPPDEEPVSPPSSEVQTPIDVSPAEAPIEEELSDSLRPVPPPVSSERPAQHPAIEEVPTLAPDPLSDPPPYEEPAEFTPPAVPQPSLSVGELLMRARRVGTGLWYAGVFLWAYLVVGEYVVGPGLPEVLGWSAFVGIVVATFLHGANRVGMHAMGKVAGLSVAAVILVILFLSTLVGSSSRSTYQGVTLFLLAVSVALILYGIRFARGGLPKPLGPKETNWRRVATWVLFVANTGLILIALLAQTAGGGSF